MLTIINSKQINKFLYSLKYLNDFNKYTLFNLFTDNQAIYSRKDSILLSKLINHEINFDFIIIVITYLIIRNLNIPVLTIYNIKTICHIMETYLVLYHIIEWNFIMTIKTFFLKYKLFFKIREINHNKNEPY
jgi:hypothetical protein